MNRFGYCPQCNEPIISVAKSPNGPGFCGNLHATPRDECLRSPDGVPFKSTVINIVEVKPSLRAERKWDVEDAKPSKDVTREYAVLRGALRNAISSVLCGKGYLPVEVAEVYRNIEAGMSMHDATRALEGVLKAALEARVGWRPFDQLVLDGRRIEVLTKGGECDVLHANPQMTKGHLELHYSRWREPLD